MSGNTEPLSRFTPAGEEFDIVKAERRLVAVSRDRVPTNQLLHQSMRTNASNDDRIDIPWSPNGRGSQITIGDGFAAMGLGRLKSVNSVMVRSTPPIQQQTFTRDSLIAEEEEVDGVVPEMLLTVDEDYDDDVVVETEEDQKPRTRIDSGTLAEPFAYETVEGAYAK
jgi:hypothetical protein